jgi:photosystem II stability/assembly factor-like uncharacterized protein
MRKILYIFILVNTSFLLSQWSWVNPAPQGNTLKQIIRLNNGNIIAAGGFGTIVVSTDGGTSWIVTHKVNDTASTINSVFRVNDNLIFAGAHESRILRSTNAGLNWAVISRIGNNLFNLRKLFFVNSSLGYALFFNQVYRTVNGGLNWTLAGGLTQQCNDIFFTDANTGYAAGGAIIDNDMLSWVIKTTNSGANWMSLPVPDVGPITRLQFLNPNVGYMSGLSSLHKTTNSGSNWITLINNPLGDQFKDFYFFDENTAYAGTYNYFLKTSNGGLDWSSMLMPYYAFNTNSGIWSISFTDLSHGAIILNEHIIARTENAGANWNIITNSFNQYVPLKSIEFLDNNTAILGSWGTTNDFIIRKTTDGGNTWPGKLSYDYQTLTGYIYDTDFPSAQTGYAVGGHPSKGYIYKSTNSGNNWIKLDSIGTGYLRSVDFINNSTGFAGGYAGEIFRTSNGGLNWTSFNTGIGAGVNSVFFVDQLTGYACGGYAAVQKVLKTTNAGLNWFDAFSTTGDSYSNIFFINSTTGFLSAKGILKTTDGGFSWVQKMPGPQLYFNGSHFPGASTGYAFATYGRVFKTTNSGENWGELGVPTDYSFADIHFLNDNTGFLIGDQGIILKTTNGGGNFVIGIEPSQTSVPHSFELYQNFPNPFNPVTVITYSIPFTAFVELVVYDATGREIKKLVNEERAQGRYFAEFDASGLSSGVYFCKLKAGEFTQTMKMILVK